MWFGGKGKEKQTTGTPTKPTVVANNPIKRNRSEDSLSQTKPDDNLHTEEDLERDEEPPVLFGKMIRFLTNKDVALMSEGIFGPFLGSETELNALKKAILIEKDNIVLTDYTKDAHVIAELLLQYLQAMPEPLLTFDMYDNFLITNYLNSHSDKLNHIKALFMNLPRGFKSAAKQTIQLLSQIQKNSSITKMDIPKLCNIFGPIFLRPREESYYMKGDELMVIELMKIMLEDTFPIFPTIFYSKSSLSASTDLPPRTISAPQMKGVHRLSLDETAISARQFINSNTSDIINSTKVLSVETKVRLEKAISILDTLAFEACVEIGRVIRDIRKELQDFFEQQKIQIPLDPTSQIQVPPKDQTPQEKLESLRRMLSIYIGSLIDFISKLEDEISKSTNTQTQSILAKELEAIAKRINTSPYLQFSKNVNSPAAKRH